MNITPLRRGLPSPPFFSASSWRSRPTFFFAWRCSLPHFIYSFILLCFFPTSLRHPLAHQFPLHPSFLSSSRVVSMQYIYNSTGGALFNTSVHPLLRHCPAPCPRMNALPHHLGTPITPYFSIIPNLLNPIPKTNSI